MIFLLFFLVYFVYAEHIDVDEAKSLFETNYSHVYYILYDTFVQAESNLKQRGKHLPLATIFFFFFVFAFHCLSSNQFNLRDRQSSMDCFLNRKDVNATIFNCFGLSFDQNGMSHVCVSV